MNAPSLTESTKQSLKGGGGEGGGGVSESLAYLLYNLLKQGWDLVFKLQPPVAVFVLLTALLERKKKKEEEEQEEEEEDDGREVNDEFIHHFKVSRG